MRWRWPLLLSGLVLFGLAGLGLLWFRAGDVPRNCLLSNARIGGFVTVPGGSFIKAAGAIYPEEGAALRLHVSPFDLSVTEVTNDQFARFVGATGYVTEAELFGGSAAFVQRREGDPNDILSWWRFKEGVSWRTPSGSGSSLDGLRRHPVVHVSLNDARAYADWAGGRLPNEVEWEYAASLGLFDPNDPESGLRGPNGEVRANTWSGLFPLFNTAEDGHVGTAPVGCYPASLIGAYDMIGNVWEWTETRFGPGQPQFTIKGGSFLCGANYCRRYRPAARESLEVDFSTAHVGFRIVRDLG